MRVQRVFDRWGRGATVLGSCAALVALCGTRSQAQARPTTAAVRHPARDVRGTVRDLQGIPIQGAAIFIAGSSRTTTTKSGEFDLRDMREAIVITVRRIGYQPLETRWDPDFDSGASLDLRLTALPEALPAVRVTARAKPYDSRLAGFNTRRQHGSGYYVTREDLDRRASQRMTDVLRELPGLRMATLPGGGSELFVRGSRCPALVYMDGFAATLGGFDLNGVDLQTIEGIEIYPNSSTVPSEFIAPGGLEQCGVVAIWSSPMRARVRSSTALRAEAVDVQHLLLTHQVYAADSVEEQATLVEGTTKVVYPDSLLRAGIGGKFFASFVVNSDGRVEAGTLTVTGTPTPAPAFIEAIRSALAGSSFTPARLGGKAVRQVTVLPFVFDASAARQSGDSGADRGQVVLEHNE